MPTATSSWDTSLSKKICQMPGISFFSIYFLVFSMSFLCLFLSCPGSLSFLFLKVKLVRLIETHPAKIDLRGMCFHLSKMGLFGPLVFSLSKLREKSKIKFLCFPSVHFSFVPKRSPSSSPSQVIMVPCVFGWEGAFSLKEFLWHNRLCLFLR